MLVDDSDLDPVPDQNEEDPEADQDPETADAEDDLEADLDLEIADVEDDQDQEADQNLDQDQDLEEDPNEIDPGLEVKIEGERGLDPDPEGGVEVRQFFVKCGNLKNVLFFFPVYCSSRPCI